MGNETQVGMQHQKEWWKFPAVKLSTEYDSEGGMFANKMSARVFNGLAKLTGSIQREPSGDLRYPILGVFTKYLSVLYDHEDRNALVTMNADFGRNLSVKYQRDINAQQGEVKVQAHTANLRYKTEISCDVPATTLPRVVCSFPVGQLRAEEVELDEDRAIALSGFLGGNLFNGHVIASYSDESATLKYTFKDEELTLVPSVSWPQFSPSLCFKRQFGPKVKLSYFHNFETTAWSAIYKYKPVDDFKVKLGYDSDVRLCWSSFWIGKEDSGAKTAPRKCKLQVMLQVPQDNVKEGAVLFRVKKRWDLC